METKSEISPMFIELKKMVDKALKEKYGEDLNIRIIRRVNQELYEIKTKHLELGFYLLGKTIYNKNLSFGIRDNIGASFLAYLLDISNVNPLKQHFFCKKCKKIKFLDFERITNNNERCAYCNSVMTLDGHDISYLSYFRNIGYNNRFYINTTPKNVEYIYIELQKIYDKRYILRNKCHESNVSDFNLFVFLPTEMNLSDASFYDEKTNIIDRNKIPNNFFKLYLLIEFEYLLLEKLLSLPNTLSMSKSFIGDENIPLFNFYFTNKFFEYASNNLLKNKHTNLKITSFEMLVKCIAYIHNTYLIKNKIADVWKFEDIYLFKDDIINDLLKYGYTYENSCYIMSKIVYRKDNDAKWISIEKSLEKDKLPYHVIDKLFFTFHIFSKSHNVSYVITDLMIAWYQMNMPAEYFKIKGELNENRED